MTTDNIKFYNLIEAFALIQSIIVFAMIIIIMVNTYVSMDKSQILLVISMQCIIILMLYWILYGIQTIYKYIKEIAEAKE
jgi:low temperature requirement protein LtrA